ncbi:hypothetical protein QBC33DRAFT_108261 [Phialemonium atrogriseum]|uniref:Uncharacterized protein n=1 Tax=Phialemonium atrogriseum TaxID=1093897 RepID=A0AAJ0FG16_9PEZI|nr:uncharacterized protein QBC33DRAFT_108261 [Phialemonium atrogriseum]KAK1766107.1 hypothetical protein QBC33DRAFT_108261 [Phialemonium atrogriseum]
METKIAEGCKLDDHHTFHTLHDASIQQSLRSRLGVDLLCSPTQDPVSPEMFYAAFYQDFDHLEHLSVVYIRRGRNKQAILRAILRSGFCCPLLFPLPLSGAHMPFGHTTDIMHALAGPRLARLCFEGRIEKRKVRASLDCSLLKTYLPTSAGCVASIVRLCMCTDQPCRAGMLGSTQSRQFVRPQFKTYPKSRQLSTVNAPCFATLMASSSSALAG